MPRSTQWQCTTFIAPAAGPADEPSPPRSFPRATPEQVALRKKAGIRADSQLDILAADHDMYVARCGGLTVKLGPRFDMPEDLVPSKEEGWEVAASGKDWAVWAKSQ